MAPLGWALVYALALFAFASWAERRGGEWIKQKLRFPAYTMALAVYCTSWTYYGAVGSAVTNGWSYLPIYIGPILVFLFGHQFLSRLVEGVKTDGANSISEFIGGRFGNSQGVAALVTILALLGSIPYIALQLRALNTSYAVLVGGDGGVATMTTAAIGLALFSMIYGTRHYVASSRSDAVLFAVGVESILKLVALVIAGAFAWLVFQNASSDRASEALQTLSRNFAPEAIGTDFFVITILSMAAIICLPRQFYVMAIEARNSSEIAKSRWPFICYMLLTAIVAIPIAIAGLSLLPATTAPDLYMLQLPLSQGWEAIALIVFLGGFSAATAMVVVESIALSTMVSNDLIAPLLVRSQRYEKPGALGKALLNVRRVIIAIIMTAALGWALGIPGNAQLASIGLVAFAAMIQFAPALILAVNGSNRDATAAKAGLSAGLGIWAYTLALPQIAGESLLAALTGTGFSPYALFGLAGLSPISHGTLWSLGGNIAVFVAVTLRRVQPTALPGLLRAPDSMEGASVSTLSELEQLVTRFVGPEIAARTLKGDHPSQKIDRSMARTAERLIAGVVGLPSARAYLRSALDGANLTHWEVARLLDDSGQSLRFSKGLLAATLENIDPGVSVIDRDLNIVAWNSRYLELFNYPPDLVRVGTPVADLIRYNALRGECGPGEVESHVEKRLNHMRRGQPHSFERVRPDGRVFKTVGGPMPSGGYVMCFTDVTAEAVALAEVQQARDELEMRVLERTSELHSANQALAEADTEKTRFLAAASHDLLQPLHAARLFSAALRRQSDEAHGPLLNKLNQSIESAELLLKSLLDISKLDAGGITPKSEVIELRPLVSGIVETLAPLAQEKGLTVRLSRGDAIVESDPGLLRSIVQNLVSNAIRYTHKGGIVVGVRKRGSNARIDVIDSGAGIPDDKRAAIFREFERLPNAGDGGIGLGLAIVKRTGRLIGARISLNSSFGKGSRFSISLPMSNMLRSKPQTIAQHETLGASHQSILIVDDDHSNCEAMAGYLAALGHRPIIFQSIHQALQCDECFDSALLDFNLGSDRDGLNLAESLLSQGRVKRVALLTAARPEDYEARAAAMGVIVLRKPINLAQLDAWLAQQQLIQAAE